MKQDALDTKETKKLILPWKTFLKNQVFLFIVGIVACITYFIIFFLKKDEVYLYLSISVLGIVLLWIGLEALVMVIKEKKKIKIVEENIKTDMEG